MALPASVRRAHRMIAAVWLLSVAVALAVSAAGVGVPPVVNITPAVLLVVLVVSGSYLLVRPWVLQYRAS